MKKIVFAIGLALLVLVPVAAHGQTNAATETLVFDSSDTYLGACSYTATSTWTLDQELTVSKFQIWYYWQANETELPVTVTKDGAAFATFTATRGSCDPYQASWCNADYAINKALPAGTYSTTIPTAYQCLKPGGTGVVRLYSLAAAATNANAAADTAPDATANANTVAQNANTVAVATDTAATDEEEGNMLVYVLIGIIVILIVVIIVMFIKCPKRNAPQQ